MLFLFWTFVAVSVVAFFAILFTGRYLCVIFDFNVGVLRLLLARGLLLLQRARNLLLHPRFTLVDVSDYRARLEVEHQAARERLRVLNLQPRRVVLRRRRA